MDIIKWDEMLLPYEQAVSELSVKFRSLSTGYEVLGKTSPIELVAQRVKRPSSILAKVRRKGLSLSQIEERIEDIAGIRLICRFAEDIDEVVRIIKDRDGMDMTVVAVRDYLSLAKESGYRSFHIIIKYPLICALGRKDVTCEIQIRTMAMNYWAVIEHDLQYKHDGKLPEEIQERLLRSAKNTEELDREFSKIHLECGNSGAKPFSKQMLTDELIKNIRVLYRVGMTKEADEYNLKLVKLFDKGSKEDFLETLAEIKELINDII